MSSNANAKRTGEMARPDTEWDQRSETNRPERQT